MKISVKLNEREEEILRYALQYVRFNFNERVETDLGIDRPEGEKEIDDLAEHLGISLDYEEELNDRHQSITMDDDIRFTFRLNHIEI